jgi:dephospho-CoA kinase
MVIGIVGKSGAGKSAAGKYFQKHGFLHIDGDRVAREVVQKGKPALAVLTAAFGEEILLADGELDRKKLGSVVFSSPEKLEKLNQITHPFILAEFGRLIAKSSKPVVIDAAALIESGFTDQCDAVIFIRSSRENRLSRILMRDKIDEETANRRIDAQKEDSFYESHATYMIDNDGSPEALEAKLTAVLNEITAGVNEKKL